ncbi:TIGR00255 family protein [Cognatiyoonia koreensis]|uniref:TIGR00255 family protein n=1 Tax=Cognatiyoonia koreensis TaxID=364200 RepID=A0A1I0P587_9RHOB|nr:YicC/YloC family endoribonuclease [Cognatiyoonia koreensis]SEW09241.1 TIGR00255 family protein [Cognatiyoonia koreensis]
MIHSMTAYASKTGALDGMSWMWEMRGVNARGLDIRLRLPDGLDGLETALRTAMKAHLKRGSITVSLRLTRDDNDQGLALDEAQLDRVLAALDTVQDRAFSMGVTLGQPTAADVLGHRGVVVQGKSNTDDGALVKALIAEIEPMLADFVAMRAAEGEAIEVMLKGQLAEIDDLVVAADKAVMARKDVAAQNFRDAVARVVSEAELDEARLVQELAMLAVKQDVTEEIDRLKAHIDAARDMIASDTPMGRKLDFLAQEFNREANTLCSKSQNTALTALGLDLKAVIDQMREQIQNVE